LCLVTPPTQPGEPAAWAVHDWASTGTDLPIVVDPCDVPSLAAWTGIEVTTVVRVRDAAAAESAAKDYQHFIEERAMGWFADNRRRTSLRFEAGPGVLFVRGSANAVHELWQHLRDAGALR
jgi:hypothetical protein